MPVSFDTETIRLVTLFENFTGCSVKDCIVDNENNTVYFVIGQGEIGKAIGREGGSVKKAESMIKKGVKIFEFSDDARRFVRNMIPQATDVRLKDGDSGNEVDVWVDKKNKAVVIGREGKNLKVFRELLHRTHNISGITVR